MIAFYSKLSEFRKNCILNEKASDYLQKSTAFYTALMTTDRPLASQELKSIQMLLAESPIDREEFFHHMWLMNAWARYQLNIVSDTEEAKKFTIFNIDNAKKLFQHQFAEDDRQKKSIIFILALNMARLSFYQKKAMFCALQLNGYHSLIFKKIPVKNDVFPEGLQDLLNTYGQDLIEGMTAEDKEYYHVKVDALELKLLKIGLSSTSLLESLKFHVNQKPQATSFIDYDKNISYSWKELDHISSGIADLIKSNVNQKTILLITQQNILHPAGVLAAWKTRNVPVMLHDSYTLHELNQLKKNFTEEPAAVLLDDKFDEKIIAKYKAVFKNVVLINESRTMEESSFAVKKYFRNEMALGLMTSGSTGAPKLCLFTHYNLVQGALIELLNEPVYQSGVIANLRPHHTSAGINSLWPAMISGSVTILSEKIRKTPIPRFLNEFNEKSKPTLLILSPAYLLSLFQNPDEKMSSTYKLPLYFGGSSLPDSVIQDLLENNFLPSMRYGMTEVIHIVSKKTFNNSAPVKSNVGVPAKYIDVSIKDGAALIKSPGLVSVIIHEGKQIAVAETDGYLTPDHAEIIADGTLLMTGRDKESLVINGFRFNSGQVEEVLLKSSTILECKVIVLDNELTAYILLKNTDDNKSAEKELKNLAEENLSPFKRPARYIALSSWPSSVNGKIDFNKLRN